MSPGFVTARRVVVFTAALIGIYILFIGPERFAFESFGTWMLSPLIYVRLLPDPFNHWLVTAMFRQPLIGHAFCVIPIAMLVAAIVLAVHAVRRNSLPSAYVSLGLSVTVFSVYHLIQPMGMSYVAY
ncbi:hypothetical protein TSACC_21591 [Terrimicrobium sacchariphilum]|jgi:hypothetical protein|uniref:Uncharacterized protein n=1 Tax=Terrimicrobium sacchariphilum TaxID=690879 RepID=A0A146G6P0_TERSA|nr:hypothetical protein [Terrimicrobium sacchariphilum]GAT33181.1 hypothetical protein TSACC_21591 [Terrimicrobium sacchariphilum]